MKIPMNTGLTRFFSGTYYTEWDVHEYDDNCEELPVEYDFKDFMKSIALAYSYSEEYILAELQQRMPFIKGIKFPGTSASPREYNFQTDVLDYVLTISKREMNRFVKDLAGDEKFAAFLLEEYSSRDGFFSFTPNNYSNLEYFIRHSKEDGFHQSLAALMNYLDSEDNSDSGAYKEIEEHVHEYWSCNGYAGLNYTVVEPEPEIDLVHS